MSQKFLEKEKDDEIEGSGIVIPETKSVSDALMGAVQQAHKEETEEDEKQGKPKKQKRGGSICFCMDPNCRIGEFIEIK